MDTLMKYHKRKQQASIRYFLMSAAVTGLAVALMLLLPIPQSLFIVHILTGIGSAVLSLVFAAGIALNTWRISGFKKPKRQHVSRWSNGYALAEEQDIQLLEGMAAYGYALVRFTNYGFYKFEMAKPEECSYSLDYSDITPTGEDFGQYKAIFEAGGWQYVCSYHTDHWFRAPKGTTPIYTDKAGMEQKCATMRQSLAWATVIHGVAAALAFAASNFISHSTVSYIFWLTGWVLVGLSCVVGYGTVMHHRHVLKFRDAQR